ncbi:Cyclin-C [Pseudolycoriella hygida]|uniref:Cyclin-C n=1 Tax=Pseudolycoriella hygida TaxID=35572 RepID=A0A9Q0N2V6_9DIPT|nr:Cyclin-C [Pseudolycoriella hygida]
MERISIEMERISIEIIRLLNQLLTDSLVAGQAIQRTLTSRLFVSATQTQALIGRLQANHRNERIQLEANYQAVIIGLQADHRDEIRRLQEDHRHEIGRLTQENVIVWNIITAQGQILTTLNTDLNTSAATNRAMRQTLLSTCTDCGSEWQPCQNVIKNKFRYAYQQEFPYRTNHILECEFYLLENLDCCLIVYQPYRLLLPIIQDIGHEDQLLPLTWRIINDSLRTDVSLLYPPYMIAIGCLQLACVILQKDVKSWFAEINVNIEKIQEISKTILGLYELWGTYDEKKEIQDLLNSKSTTTIN